MWNTTGKSVQHSETSHQNQQNSQHQYNAHVTPSPHIYPYHTTFPAYTTPQDIPITNPILRQQQRMRTERAAQRLRTRHNLNRVDKLG